MAIGNDAYKNAIPVSSLKAAGLPAKTPVLTKIKTDNKNPYKPWVPGNTCKIKTLPNNSGFLK